MTYDPSRPYNPTGPDATPCRHWPLKNRMGFICPICDEGPNVVDHAPPATPPEATPEVTEEQVDWPPSLKNPQPVQREEWQFGRHMTALGAFVVFRLGQGEMFDCASAVDAQSACRYLNALTEQNRQLQAERDELDMKCDAIEGWGDELLGEVYSSHEWARQEADRVTAAEAQVRTLTEERDEWRRWGPIPESANETLQWQLKAAHIQMADAEARAKLADRISPCFLREDGLVTEVSIPNYFLDTWCADYDALTQNTLEEAT